MIRFIKKICYFLSKRFIRFFIYFSVLSVFLVSTCFASSNYYYDSFSDLVGNGNVYVSIGMDYSLDFSNQSVPDFNDVVVRDNGGDRFNSFGVLIGSKDGIYPTVSGQVSHGDVLMLEHFVRIECEKGSAYYVSGEITNNAYLKLITDEGNFDISGRSFYDDLIVTSTNDKDIITLHIKVNYKFNSDNFIRGISYNFLQIFDSGLVTCRFVPVSLDDGYLFYLGDSQDAPVFSDFKDFGSSIDDVISSEDALLSEYDYASQFNSFNTWVNSFASNLYYARAFSFITSILSLLFNNIAPIRIMVNFALYFGIIFLLLGASASVISFFRGRSNG